MLYADVNSFFAPGKCQKFRKSMKTVKIEDKIFISSE